VAAKANCQREVEPMPIERELSKILALSDEDFFRWLADARAVLAEHFDAELSALSEASIGELVERAGRAWSAEGYNQEGRTAMDDGTTGNPPVEDSIDLLREHRAEMALWLAIEVLQLDPVALEDDELLARLGCCQERLEERLRARTSQREGARRPSDDRLDRA
jgi:DNA-binding transcriptional ArsR family regulator